MRIKKARVPKNPGIVIQCVFCGLQAENNIFVQDSCMKHADHINHERSFQVCRPLRCKYSIGTGIVCKDRKSITLFSRAQILHPGYPENTPAGTPDIRHMKFNINTLFCPDCHPVSNQFFHLFLTSE